MNNSTYIEPNIGDIVEGCWIGLHDEGFSYPILIWENVHKSEIGTKINFLNQGGFKKPNGLFKGENNE